MLIHLIITTHQTWRTPNLGTVRPDSSSRQEDWEPSKPFEVSSAQEGLVWYLKGAGVAEDRTCGPPICSHHGPLNSQLWESHWKHTAVNTDPGSSDRQEQAAILTVQGFYFSCLILIYATFLSVFLFTKLLSFCCQPYNRILITPVLGAQQKWPARDPCVHMFRQRLPLYLIFSFLILPFKGLSNRCAFIP